MNTANIIAALDEELSRLRQVRDLLSGGTPPPPAKRGPGRPPKSASAAAPTPAAPAAKKRQLSDEARQRIAEAQKKRWAAQKRDSQ